MQAGAAWERSRWGCSRRSWRGRRRESQILRVPAGVTGLTSAATIWFLGAIGVLIGCNYRLAGILLTLAVLVILLFTRRIERFLLRRGRLRLTLGFQGDSAAARRATVEALMNHGAPPIHLEGGSSGRELVVNIEHLGPEGPEPGLLAELWRLPGTVSVDWQRR